MFLGRKTGFDWVNENGVLAGRKPTDKDPTGSEEGNKKECEEPRKLGEHIWCP